jgi:prevent-host-death family protein
LLASANPTALNDIGDLDKLAKLDNILQEEGHPMSTLTFRNRQGALVDIPTVKATQVKNEFGSILEKATRSGAVAITRHAAPKAVLLSYEEFESLVQVQSRTLENLGAEFDDLLDRMQTAKAKKGMASAFHASPAKLGRAAIRAARKNR